MYALCDGVAKFGDQMDNRINIYRSDHGAFLGIDFVRQLSSILIILVLRHVRLMVLSVAVFVTFPQKRRSPPRERD